MCVPKHLRTGCPRHGFTLRELLICIAVVGGLLAILIPALRKNKHRSVGATHCQNRMKELTIACDLYVYRQQKYPGYDNLLAGRHASWIVLLLRDIRADIYRESSNPMRAIPNVHVETLSCRFPQSDNGSNSKPGRLNSYVANCGRADTGAPPQDNPANGVFLNRYSGQAVMTPEYIAGADGLETTVLFSESIQAGPWAAAGEVETEMTLGFVWHDDSEGDQIINSNTIKFGKVASTFDAARPSSYHPGGVNMAFCTERIRFIAESIDYKVYQQLMTSDSAKSDLPEEVKAYRLAEKDLW